MTSHGHGKARWPASRAEKVMTAVLLAGIVAVAGCAQTRPLQTDTPGEPDEPVAESEDVAPGQPDDAWSRYDRGQRPERDPRLDRAPAAEDRASDEVAENEPLRPPGLDLAPEDARERVEHHVGEALDALHGDPRDPDRAITQTRHALTIQEDNLAAMLVLAWSHYLKGHHDMAESVLEVAKERASGLEHPRYHFIAGLVHDAADRDDEAQRSYERAVQLQPSYQSALLNLGVHYLRNRRYPEAIRSYEQLTGELGDNRPASWTNLGSAYRGRASELEGPAGDPSRRTDYLRRAQRAYERALRHDSNYAPAYYNLGILHLDAEPFPDNGGELATLDRLRRAAEHFDRYRNMPGADVARADEQATLAQDRIAREERREELRQRREERSREREREGDP